MQFKTYLEKYYTPEFTFGFELEGYFDVNLTPEELKSLSNSFFSSNKTLFNYGANVTSATSDSSLGSEDFFDEKYGYELKSPVLQFTPDNLQNTLKFLNYLIINDYIITDETCAFHVHIGFPETDTKVLGAMMMWIFFNLAIDNKYTIKDLTEMKGKDTTFGFVTHEYSSTHLYDSLKNDINEFIDKLEIDNESLKLIKQSRSSLEQKKIIEEFFGIILQHFKNEKFVILRMHPQGTLEWRGPRGFLDRGYKDDIKSFLFRKLYPFVKWISDILDTKEVIIDNTFIIKRDIFYKFLINQKKHQIVDPKSNKFHIGMTYEMKKTIIQNFKWVSPNKLKYEHALIILYKNKPCFVKGILSNSTWKEGTFCSIAENCKFINSLITSQLDESNVDFIDYNKKERMTLINYLYVRLNDCQIKDCFIHNINSFDSFFENCTIGNSDINSDCKINSCKINENKINGTDLIKIESNKNEFYVCVIKDSKCNNDGIQKTKIFNSQITNCHITDYCQLDNSNFNLCTFDGYSINIASNNNKFSYCTFNATALEDLKAFSFNECKFDNCLLKIDSIFKNGTFDKCQIYGGTYYIDNIIFNNCEFYNGIYIDNTGKRYSAEEMNIKFKGIS